LTPRSGRLAPASTWTPHVAGSIDSCPHKTRSVVMVVVGWRSILPEKPTTAWPEGHASRKLGPVDEPPKRGVNMVVLVVMLEGHVAFASRRPESPESTGSNAGSDDASEGDTSEGDPSKLAMPRSEVSAASEPTASRIEPRS